MIDLAVVEGKGIVIRDGRKFYTVSLGKGRERAFSVYKYRQLRNRSIIMGYVGARGSGKSVGAARMIVLDYFLRGCTNIWSNMDIAFRLIHDGKAVILRTKPLDKLSLVDLDELYSGGVLFIDEVPAWIADSRRAMSAGNLAFSYIIMQLRKRRLNMIWTAQSEYHVEGRLRDATDIFILCKDSSIKNPKLDMGVFSQWKVYDMSGVVRGEAPTVSDDAVIWRGTIKNKPWWNLYDTYEIQGIERKGANSVSDSGSNRALPKSDGLVTQIISELTKAGIKRLPVNDIWSTYGVKEFSERVKIGVKLAKAGLVKKRLSDGSYYYELTSVT